MTRYLPSKHVISKKIYIYIDCKKSKCRIYQNKSKLIFGNEMLYEEVPVNGSVSDSVPEEQKAAHMYGNDHNEVGELELVQHGHQGKYW